MAPSFTTVWTERCQPSGVHGDLGRQSPPAAFQFSLVSRAEELAALAWLPSQPNCATQFITINWVSVEFNLVDLTKKSGFLLDITVEWDRVLPGPM